MSTFQLLILVKITFYINFFGYFGEKCCINRGLYFPIHIKSSKNLRFIIYMHIFMVWFRKKHGQMLPLI